MKKKTALTWVVTKTVFLVSRYAEILQGAQSSWNRFQSHGTTIPQQKKKGAQGLWLFWSFS